MKHKATHIDLFDMLADRPDSVPVEKGLLVISTPRSGSTLFCDILTNSGQIGICDEWFNECYFAVWQEMMDLEEFNMKDYILWIARKTVGDTGVIALHVHVGQLIHVCNTYQFSFGDMAFDHVAWVYRKDKIAQAVSLAKANSTDCWKSTEMPKCDPDLSYRNISAQLNYLIDHDQFYRDHISIQLDAKSYEYTEFCTLPWGKNSPFNRVLSALGKPLIDVPKASTKKQGNADTKRMTTEFRNYLSGV